MKVESVNIQNLQGTQAINIPPNLKINDDKVYIKKIGNALYLIPFHNPWQNLMDSLNEFTSDDTLIAAHAKSLQYILVTNNEREFRRIESLEVENWVE